MKKRKMGFTLIELLIVVTIVGIIASLSYGSYVSKKYKARYYSAVSNVQVIAAAEKTYFLSEGVYVGTANTLDTNNQLGLNIRDGFCHNFHVNLGAPLPYSIVVDCGPSSTYTFDSNGIRIGCIGSDCLP